MEENKLDIPMNVNERYLYGINLRLDALCAMMESFLTAYAEINKLSTQSHSATMESIVELDEAVVEVQPTQKKKKK